MTDFVCAALEVKSFGDPDAGLFSGYGAVFHTADLVGDRILPGAFSESLAERKALGRPVPMHFNHGLNELGGERAIGAWLDMQEDGTGLRVEGKIAGMKTERGRYYYERLRDGAITGLSIGYRVKRGDASYPQKQGEPARIIKRAQLAEVSIVDDPAHPHARVLAVKSLAGEAAALEQMEEFKARLAAGILPTEREAERFLRDVGLPRSLAADLIAGRGWKTLRQRDAAEGEASKAAVEAARQVAAVLDGFALPKL